MFRKLIARISTLESPPPWTALTGISSVIAAFAAIIVGTAIATIALQNVVQYTALLGWIIGAAITLLYVYIRFRKPEERAALKLGIGDTPTKDPALTVQQILLMLLIGVGLSVALDVVSGRVTNTFLPEPELLNLYLDASLRGFPILFLSWIFAFVFMVIAQPISEEIVFRGVLLPALRKATGAWPGYILSAILYAVFHLMAYSTSINDFNSLWYGQILPFIAGLIFGAVRLYTGSTRAAILAHAGFGLFALVKIVTLVG